MMYDLRNYKSIVADEIRKVNEKIQWKWRATVNKSEIKLTNGYIKGQYSGDFKDYFSVKLYDDGEDVFLEGRDCLTQCFTCKIVGDRYGKDGPLEKCIRETIADAEIYFKQVY